MAIRKMCFLLSVALILTCKIKNYNLISQFDFKTNTTKLSLKTKPEVYINLNSYYGKEQIQPIDDNLWRIDYSIRCGTGCKTNVTSLLKYEKDSLIQDLKIISKNIEYITNDKFQIIDSTAFMVKFDIIDSNTIICNYSGKKSKLQLQKYKKSYKFVLPTIKY